MNCIWGNLLKYTSQSIRRFIHSSARSHILSMAAVPSTESIDAVTCSSSAENVSENAEGNVSDNAAGIVSENATGSVRDNAASNVSDNAAGNAIDNAADNVPMLPDVNISSAESETEIPPEVEKNDGDLLILSASETSSSPNTTTSKLTDATEGKSFPVCGQVEVKKPLLKDISSPAAPKRSFFTSSSSITATGSPLWTSSPQDHRTREQAMKVEKERILSLPLAKKRQLYYCGNDYFTLEEILTWHDQMKKDRIKRRYPKADDIEHHFSDFRYEADEQINKKVSIWRGDITRLEIDAIVNAANSSLLGGGGVDGAIHRAAGSALLTECRTLNGCQTGDAKTTAGYRLPAKYVVHTVGPQGEYQKLLRSCYHRCLLELDKNHLKSIAFPCISTGIYGYSNEKAVHVALKTVRDWLNDKKVKQQLDSVDRVIFCVFLDVDMRLYESWMQVYFPDSSKLTPEPPPGQYLDAEEKTTSNRNSLETPSSRTKLNVKSADFCSEVLSIELSDSDATDGDQETAKTDAAIDTLAETPQPTKRPPIDSVSLGGDSHVATESVESTGRETVEEKVTDCTPEQVTLKAESETLPEKLNDSSPSVELPPLAVVSVELPEKCYAEVDPGCIDNEIRENEMYNGEQILTLPEVISAAAELKPLSPPTHIPVFEANLSEQLVSETIPPNEDCDSKTSSGNVSAACKRHELDSPSTNMDTSEQCELAPKRQKCDEFSVGSESQREGSEFCVDDETNEQRAACIKELLLDEEFHSPDESA